MQLLTIFVRLFALLISLHRRAKRAVVVGVDIGLCIVATLIAFSLRVGALSFPVTPVLQVLAVAIPSLLIFFHAANVYGNIFRFAGARAIQGITKAVALYSLPLIAIFLFGTIEGVPRTIAVLQPLLLYGLVVGSRILGRYLLVDLLLPSFDSSDIRRVVVYGAGSAGRQVLLALRADPRTVPVAFVDDDRHLSRQRMDGVMVHHSDALPDLVKLQNVHTVLLALPGISRKRRRRIVEKLRPLNVHVQILPAVHDIVDGSISVSDIREVQIDDLLGRDPVAPKPELLSRTVTGKTVLVTGAGGSIGSELCRQIARNGADTIVLFEQSEFALYQIERDLQKLKVEHDLPGLRIVPLLGSVLDELRLASVFAQHPPQTVFHAAAYKHVPLVESNRLEGIRNNVLGTWKTLSAASEAQVADFILISTDKAVRPTSVMGASKRAAEQVAQAYAHTKKHMRVSMVRFGNVLGSSGSVVPLFQSQVKAGGPVTITDFEVTRFFMTIPEAANLVLQASGLARGGEVFVLDMGNPVRIADLAAAVIELSGLSVKSDLHPDGDIEIVEIGLRPGEKLYEELLIGNDPKETAHKRIMMAREAFLPLGELTEILAQLDATRDEDTAMQLLGKLVPELGVREEFSAREAPAVALGS